MDSVTVHAHISAPREDVFALIADVAARPAWCDHFMKDYRLLTPRSTGVGAGARFRLDWRGGTRYVEYTIVDARSPRRIVEDGRTGRLGRTLYGAEYDLTSPSAGLTRVELTLWTEPENPVERLREALGFRSFMRKRSRRALDRLRAILEEDRDGPLARATIAGYEPRKAPRFGTRAGRSFRTEPDDGGLPAARPEPPKVAE
ncbi:MAG TPA: SRPBCC family protein [Thermoleophilaceae bacterium]|nr:SRPBCC family protein [Thermoleophilaceae bacterium]